MMAVLGMGPIREIKQSLEEFDCTASVLCVGSHLANIQSHFFLIGILLFS